MTSEYLQFLKSNSFTGLLVFCPELRQHWDDITWVQSLLASPRACEVPLLSSETLLEPFPMCPFGPGGWCLGDNWGTVWRLALKRSCWLMVGLLPDILIVSGRTDQSRLAQENFVRNASLRGLSSYGLERNCQCHRESLCNQVRSQLWVGLCWTRWTIAPNSGDIDHGYLRKVEAKCMQDAERLEHYYPKSSDLKIWRFDPWPTLEWERR